MSVKFGPAGMGPVKEVEKTFEQYNKSGIKAATIPFTYSVYIKKIEDALRIKETAEKFGIEISIHAPYWINLNSVEQEKVEASKKRILDSCKIGEWVGAKEVVFHPGFYGKSSEEETYQKIKKEIQNIQKEIRRNQWGIELAPEIMGKKNVFGSIEEIERLARETNCGFCIDFAHLIARYETIDWKILDELFPHERWHCHFSGIEYGEKGEKYHKKTGIEDWEKLLSKLPKNRQITIINESPSPVKDSVLGLMIYNGISRKL